MTRNISIIHSNEFTLIPLNSDKFGNVGECIFLKFASILFVLRVLLPVLCYTRDKNCNVECMKASKMAE
jgi:hypothetical protein